MTRRAAAAQSSEDTAADRLPRYADLPRVPGVAARHAWGQFGPDDSLGTLNLLTAARTRHAASLVRRGAVFPLNWRLEMPDPPMFGRLPIRHSMKVFPNGTDDYYDDFYPQISSQWDALSHVGHPTAGFYGGRSVADVRDPATNPLGIDHAARRGICGRFVLLDIGRDRDARGQSLDMNSATAIAPGELDGVLAEQGVELRRGDILLLRFGWITWYEGAPQTARDRVPRMGREPTPGLAQSEAMAEWVWDHGIAAIAADNPGVERYPEDAEDIDRNLHQRLLAFLGLALGELFDLDALAADCASDGVYEGLFTAAPLNKRGGSGSTSNAIALK